MSHEPNARHPGAARVPTGDPLVDGVGPAAWADRPDHPDPTLEGEPRIQPMSVLEGWEVHPKDPDPRGWPVVDPDGAEMGTVEDIWVDRSEPAIRYVDVTSPSGHRFLLPYGFYKVKRRAKQLRVKALKARHVDNIPRPAANDRITLQEEDRVMAYWAGGYLYAEPDRAEPWL